MWGRSTKQRRAAHRRHAYAKAVARGEWWVGYRVKWIEPPPLSLRTFQKALDLLYDRLVQEGRA